MCLTVDKEKTKNFSSKTKTFTFYKNFLVYVSWPKTIATSVQFSKIPINYKNPIVAEGCINIVRSETESEIHSGVIHAYVSKNHSIIGLGPNIITIPITVESNDIVAFGTDDDVCFWKYTIPQESWNLVKLKLKELKKSIGS